MNAKSRPGNEVPPHTPTDGEGVGVERSGEQERQEEVGKMDI